LITPPKLALPFAAAIADAFAIHDAAISAITLSRHYFHAVMPSLDIRHAMPPTFCCHATPLFRRCLFAIIYCSFIISPFAAIAPLRHFDYADFSLMPSLFFAITPFSSADY
jgi:hypothetical protein